MAKRLVLCSVIIFLCSQQFVFSTNPDVIDSLKKVLQNVSDTTKINVSNEIAFRYYLENDSSAYQYLYDALKLGESIDFDKGKARSYFMLGLLQYRHGNYELATDNLEQSREIYLRLDYKSALAEACRFLGNAHLRLTSYEKALEYYLQSLQINKKLGKKKSIAENLNGVGNIYFYQLNYDKAMEYFEQSLRISRQIGAKSDIASGLNNIGNVYYARKDYNKALEYYKATLEIDKEMDNKMGMTSSLNNLGVIYKLLGDYKKAIKYQELSLEIDEELGNKTGKAASYNNIGGIYNKLKDYNKAREYIQKSIAISKEIGDMRILKDGLLNMAETYRESNQFKDAFEYLAQYVTIRDSMFNVEKSKIIAEMQARYDLKEKEIEIEVLKKDKQIKDNQIKRQKLLSLSIGGGSALIILLIFLVYNRYRIKQKLLMEKQLVDLELRTLHLQMNPHFIFNSLGSISSFVSQNDSKSAVRYLAKFSKLMRYILESSQERFITLEKEIDNLSLYLELEQLRFDNKFDYKIDKQTEIQDNLLVPHMLIQPFVENSLLHGIKHKETKGNINVSFFIENKQIICEVEDDGVGREAAAIIQKRNGSQHKSLGMKTTLNKIEILNSIVDQQFEIDIIDLKDEFGEPRGTRVRFVLGIAE